MSEESLVVLVLETDAALAYSLNKVVNPAASPLMYVFLCCNFDFVISLLELMLIPIYFHCLC